jgi:CheY-like chemotaxis protein
MEATPLKLTLVEDDPVVRSIVTATLRRSVVGWSLDRLAAPDRWVEHVCRTRPDVLLVDHHVGGRDVAPALATLAGSLPTTMVAALLPPPARRAEQGLREAGAFVCYEKRSMHARHLGAYLRDDLRLFLRAMAGEQVHAPSCHDRFVTAARAWRTHATSPTVRSRRP